MVIAFIMHIRNNMRLNITSSAAQAAALGLVAGMRSFSAPAIVSHMYSRHPATALRGTPFNFVQTINASKVFKVLAAAELVGDKLPAAPNRTNASALIARILSGAFSGAAVYKARDKNAVVGGIIGGVAAFASTFGCFYLRKATVKNTALPDVIVALIEDAIVVTAGASIAKQNNV
jgi:uncharacterized membrane protein